VTVVIRPASESERDDIIDLVRRAFSDRTRDGSYEVGIVAQTWRRQASPKDLELVAEDDGSIVGHVLAAVGDIDGGPMIGIAPLSVSPERQGQGIGSALMRDLLRRVEAAGWPIALLLGDPHYYSRFGFRPAAEFGITYGPAGADNPAFMARAFTTSASFTDAVFRYCWEQCDC
jgi:putative acetyltransferase